MFPRRFFAARFFAPRFWCKVGGVSVADDPAYSLFRSTVSGGTGDVFRGSTPAAGSGGMFRGTTPSGGDLFR